MPPYSLIHSLVYFVSTKFEVLSVKSRHKQLAKRERKRETDGEWREPHKRDKRRKGERKVKTVRKDSLERGYGDRLKLTS